MTVIYPGQVAIEIMRALANGDDIATGDNDGVESIVRAFAESAEFACTIFPTPTNAETGKPDWDVRHAHLPDGMDVLVVHADPHASHVVASVFKVLDEDHVRLVSTLDAL